MCMKLVKVVLYQYRFSNQLYHKQTRFVYELIQNAEDNTHDICEAKDILPVLQFTVSPGSIVIDSNEDRFTFVGNSKEGFFRLRLWERDWKAEWEEREGSAIEKVIDR